MDTQYTQHPHTHSIHPQTDRSVQHTPTGHTHTHHAHSSTSHTDDITYTKGPAFKETCSLQHLYFVYRPHPCPDCPEENTHQLHAFHPARNTLPSLINTLAQKLAPCRPVRVILRVVLLLPDYRLYFHPKTPTCLHPACPAIRYKLESVIRLLHPVLINSYGGSQHVSLLLQSLLATVSLLSDSAVKVAQASTCKKFMWWLEAKFKLNWKKGKKNCAFHNLRLLDFRHS